MTFDSLYRHECLVNICKLYVLRIPELRYVTSNIFTGYC